MKLRFTVVPDLVLRLRRQATGSGTAAIWIRRRPENQSFSANRAAKAAGIRLFDVAYLKSLTIDATYASMDFVPAECGIGV